MLDYDLFTRVVDEAGPTVGRIDSSTTARPSFIKRALDMVEYHQVPLPHVYRYTAQTARADRGRRPPSRALRD